MKNLISAAAAFIVLGAASPASADYLTGNDLYAACTSSSSSDLSICLGFIAGVRHSMAVMELLYETPRTVCDDRVTTQQIMDTVTAYLRDYPVERNEHAGVLVVSVMAGAWPCDT